DLGGAEPALLDPDTHLASLGSRERALDQLDPEWIGEQGGPHRSRLRRRGDAVEPRTTSSTGNTFRRLPASCPSRIRPAVSPLFTRGWWIVVRLGVTTAAAGTSSIPTTERSSGTCRPASRAAPSTPIASWSESVRMPVGGSLRSSISSAIAAPPAGSFDS